MTNVYWNWTKFSSGCATRSIGDFRNAHSFCYLWQKFGSVFFLSRCDVFL